jgi:hypothetical protein
VARKSFVLRNTSSTATTRGSYLQYPSGSEAASLGLVVRDDIDTSLRSDQATRSVDVISEPITEPVLRDPLIPGYSDRNGNLLTKVSFFESHIVDYDAVELSWGANLSTTLTTTPQPTRVIINYSSLGEPQTVSDGLSIIDTNTASKVTHRPTPGEWAYYSLFVKYEAYTGNASAGASTPVMYYEKAASMAELMPKNYGCTDDMYSKIPAYYRSLDGDLDNGVGGPLYRLISLFGFEVDRTRTIIDYLMSFKDPMFAHSEVLDVISKDLSLGIRSDEIGTPALREVLNSIGSIRRTFGTPLSVKTIVEALTGSYVDINELNNVIKVYAQRVNLLKDPDIYSGARGSFAGGSPYTTDFSTTLLTGGASVPSVTFTYSGGDPYSSLTTIDEFPLDPTVEPSPFDDPATFNELWSYFPDPASGGSTTVLQTIEPYVYVTGGETLTFSIQGSLYTNAQDSVLRVAFYGVGEGAASAGYTGIGSSLYSTLDGAEIVGTDVFVADANGSIDDSRSPAYEGGIPSSVFFTDYYIAGSSEPVTIGGIKYWNITIPDTITDYTQVFFAVFIGPNANLLKGFAKMLLERTTAGEYFDGNSINGSWLVDSPTGSRVSDYRWYHEPEPSSPTQEGEEEFNYSVYNSNYQKKRALLNRYLIEMLPVNQLSKSDTVYSNDTGYLSTPVWAINWNAIPGVPYNYTVAP